MSESKIERMKREGEEWRTGKKQARTVVEQLVDERAENEALRAKLKAAEARAPAVPPPAAATVKAPATPLTSAMAHIRYNSLTDPRERTEFRKANWKLLGIKEEK